MWPCDLDLWSWRSRRSSLMRFFVLRLCTKFEVRRPFHFGRYWTVTVWALVSLVTLTFDLEPGEHYCSWVYNLPTNFRFPRMFRSSLIGQHLSEASRDLATLSFELEVHGACRWCRSLCCICVPSLKFVDLHVRKIFHIYCLNINRPGDLGLWPFELLNRPLCSLVTSVMASSCVIWVFYAFLFSIVMSRHATDGRTDRQLRAIYNAPPYKGINKVLTINESGNMQSLMCLLLAVQMSYSWEPA